MEKYLVFILCVRAFFGFSKIRLYCFPNSLCQFRLTFPIILCMLLCKFRNLPSSYNIMCIIDLKYSSFYITKFSQYVKNCFSWKKSTDDFFVFKGFLTPNRKYSALSFSSDKFNLTRSGGGNKVH